MVVIDILFSTTTLALSLSLDTFVIKCERNRLKFINIHSLLRNRTFPWYLLILWLSLHTDEWQLRDNKDDELCKLSLIGVNLKKVNFDNNLTTFSRSLASALSLFFYSTDSKREKGKKINRKPSEEIFRVLRTILKESFVTPTATTNIQLVYYYTMNTAHVFFHFCYNIAYDYFNNSGLVRVINYLFPHLPKCWPIASDKRYRKFLNFRRKFHF